MTLTALSDEKVDATLDSLVKKFGEGYIYPGWNDGKCVYVQDGAPSCLVGHALNRLGVPIGTLEVLDEQQFYRDEELEDLVYINGLQEIEVIGYLEDSERLIDFEEAAGVTLTPYARRVLAGAQHLQDEGVEWGVAVQRAREWALDTEKELREL